MHFPEPVLFEIPVRPRIKKFIQGHLQGADGKPRPMLVEAGPLGLGLNLWGLCQSEKVQMNAGWRRADKSRSQAAGNQQQTDGSGRIMGPADMTARIGVGIREFHSSRSQYLLNYAELETFSSWVDYIILNEMVSNCEAAPDVAPLVRIKQFCDRYDFSADELHEEKLRTIYYRHRTGKDSSYNFHPELSRQIHFRPMSRQAA